MSKPRQKKAIIVGAGAGGIATAARLAKAGFSVTVLEKNSFTGGRCSLLYHDDDDDNDGGGSGGSYRFDQGPSLLLLPKLFEETFADLDTSLPAEGIALLRCASNYRVWFADGESFELTPDLAQMRAQIERWEGPQGFPRFLSWLHEAHAHCELSAREVLHRNFGKPWDMRVLLGPSLLARLHPFHSVWGRASRYFRTERLRRVFTFATMYMGMSPFDAPATYSLLQYAELAEGIWYPRGGFHAVLAALQRVGERLGVEYRLDAPVAQILMDADGKAARGVRLESGEVLDGADVVVVNADLVYAYGNLFPQTPAVRRHAASLRRRPASCSSISFYWSLDRRVPELQTHNIFLADEYRESFDAIFDRRALPDEPSFYVNVPSRIDPSAAPDGRDALIVLVPTGHLPESAGILTPSSSPSSSPSLDANWLALISRARQAVLSTIEARTGCAPLAGLITREMVNDPRTWESRFNLDKGSILGLSHGFFNVLAFRPGTRAAVVGGRNTYFVGASTHPGTGVPIVLAGAKITAEQILGDLQIPAPWPSGGGGNVLPAGRTNGLDRIRSPPLSVRGWLFYVVVAAWVAYLSARYYPLLRREGA
ncbi:hypothetical protein F5X99DRAFT_427941 [Biscogniauxia marginata]|nr:hypothetical protein F5X99DRAFT_427941 [Biscogniauxia marginata]